MFRMQGQAVEVGQKIIAQFEAKTVPATLANVFINRQDLNIPSNKWSWSNQFLVALNGFSDARGFRQWESVGRYVRKGEKSFRILIPMIKHGETENSKGETEEYSRLLGFKDAPVFGLEQTDGKELPRDEKTDKFLASLPLVEVAKSWGLNIGAYNGAGADYAGAYTWGRSITLGVENLSTWAHELVHASEDKLGVLRDSNKPEREVVAELGGAVLLTLLGRTVEADLGGCFEYVSSYANGDTVKACITVLNRVCNAVELILAEAQKLGIAVTIPSHELVLVA